MCRLFTVFTPLETHRSSEQQIWHVSWTTAPPVEHWRIPSTATARLHSCHTELKWHREHFLSSRYTDFEQTQRTLSEFLLHKHWSDTENTFWAPAIQMLNWHREHFLSFCHTTLKWHREQFLRFCHTTLKWHRTLSEFLPHNVKLTQRTLSQLLPHKRWSDIENIFWVSAIHRWSDTENTFWPNATQILKWHREHFLS